MRKVPLKSNEVKQIELNILKHIKKFVMIIR